MLIAFIGNYDDIYYGAGLIGHPVMVSRGYCSFGTAECFFENEHLPISLKNLEEIYARLHL